VYTSILRKPRVRRDGKRTGFAASTATYQMPSLLEEWERGDAGEQRTVRDHDIVFCVDFGGQGDRTLTFTKLDKVEKRQLGEKGCRYLRHPYPRRRWPNVHREWVS